MPPPEVNPDLEVDNKYIHYLGSAGKTNGTGRDTRSVTPAGFAEAVFKANSQPSNADLTSPKGKQ